MNEFISIPSRPSNTSLVPVIVSDGQEEASISEHPSGVEATYRGAVYEIHLRAGRVGAFTDDPPASNRNALYRTWKVCDKEVRISLQSGN